MLLILPAAPPFLFSAFVDLGESECTPCTVAKPSVSEAEC